MQNVLWALSIAKNAETDLDKGISALPPLVKIPTMVVGRCVQFKKISGRMCMDKQFNRPFAARVTRLYFS